MTAAKGEGLGGTEEMGRIVDRRRIRLGLGGGGWRFLMIWEKGPRMKVNVVGERDGQRVGTYV